MLVAVYVLAVLFETGKKAIDFSVLTFPPEVQKDGGLGEGKGRAIGGSKDEAGRRKKVEGGGKDEQRRRRGEQRARTEKAEERDKIETKPAVRTRLSVSVYVYQD